MVAHWPLAWQTVILELPETKPVKVTILLFSVVETIVGLELLETAKLPGPKTVIDWLWPMFKLRLLWLKKRPLLDVVPGALTLTLIVLQELALEQTVKLVAP